MNRKEIRPAEAGRRGDGRRAPTWNPLREWNLSRPALPALVDPAREMEAVITCRFRITGAAASSSRVRTGGGA